MKKQVYKVGQTVKVVEHELEDGRHIGKVGLLHKIFKDGTYSVYGDWGHAFATEIELISPLKPKKSIKKKETKVQELERRIKALEAHRCNPVPQVPNVPAIPFQRYYCDRCGGSYINNQGFHYC